MRSPPCPISVSRARAISTLGMVIAIEPMLNIGGWGTRSLADKWTVVTADGSLSAHFEHTVAIMEDAPEVLTAVQ